MDVSLRKERGTFNHYFTPIIFGGLIGLPLLPLYYPLRLLPHIFPGLKAWKQSMLRERDLTDQATDLQRELRSFHRISGSKLKKDFWDTQSRMGDSPHDGIVFV
ncbi:MAG: hypothetical protein JXL20_12735 [Deltaproteobacteria bacterium]|nr:hypothetical protein [Deltaproteobacteria bacterium]